MGQNNQIQDLVVAGIEKLKEAGFKSTKKRQEIIELFAENQRYLNAAFIHQEMSERYPTMSYNTTYRNIYDFVEHRYARIELAKVKGLLEATK